MNFKSLDEYYDYLENDYEFSHLDLNTYKYITSLRDKTEDDNKKKFCSYELFFADFYIEEGKHIPKFQIGANVYPALELFDDNFPVIFLITQQIPWMFFLQLLKAQRLRYPDSVLPVDLFLTRKNPVNGLMLERTM